MASNLPRPLPPALPADIKDWTRHIKAERTLNDLVEDVHCSLVKDDEYRALLRATYDAHAVEGSCSADNIMAAKMIREKAQALEITELQNEKLAVISMALGVVLRRYQWSRKQRRNMVAGEEVNNGAED